MFPLTPHPQIFDKSPFIQYLGLSPCRMLSICHGRLPILVLRPDGGYPVKRRRDLRAAKPFALRQESNLHGPSRAIQPRVRGPRLPVPSRFASPVPTSLRLIGVLHLINYNRGFNPSQLLLAIFPRVLANCIQLTIAIAIHEVNYNRGRTSTDRDIAHILHTNFCFLTNRWEDGDANSHLTRRLLHHQH